MTKTTTNDNKINININTQNNSSDADKDNIDFLTVKQLAGILGCSMPTARKIMYRRDFPSVVVGRTRKVERSALLKWSQNRRN